MHKQSGTGGKKSCNMYCMCFTFIPTVSGYCNKEGRNDVLHYSPEQILHAAMKMRMYCHAVVQSKVLLQINILFPSAGLGE